MSVGNLGQPNSNILYCGSLTASVSINSSLISCNLLLLNAIIFNGLSKLNYYEETKQPALFSGIYEYTYPDGLIITRIGKIVTCKIRSYISTTKEPDKLIIGEIPERFAPDNDIAFRILILKDDIYDDGLAIIKSDGYIEISPGNTPDNIFESGSSGLPFDIELTYQTDL